MAITIENGNKSDIGPLDYLFCRKCDEHKYTCYFHYTSIEQTNEGFRLGARPKCNDCNEFLIQKYQKVVVRLEMDK